MSISEIQDFLKKGWVGLTPDEMRAYMERLCVYKSIVNEERGRVNEQLLNRLSEYYDAKDELIKDAKFQSFEKKDIRDIFLKFESSEIYKLERLSSSITYQIDGLKSCLYGIQQEIKHLGGYER